MKKGKEPRGAITNQAFGIDSQIGRFGAICDAESFVVVAGSVVVRFASPPLDGLARQLRRKRDRAASGGQDSFVRETFVLPRNAARMKAREWFERYPKAAYWTSVETWRVLPGDEIEFTMRRLPGAD